MKLPKRLEKVDDSVTKSYSFFIKLEIACLVTLILSTSLLIVKQLKEQKNLIHASHIRYTSYQLADQLRQSSDDLTRMVRSYAITGDKKFEQYFWQILDIRDGREPRPVNYERVYWDFMTIKHPKAPFKKGEKEPLEDLMKKAGFIQDEFILLAEAKKRSDKLVFLENTAMNAMKGKFLDSEGDFTIIKEPDLEMAKQILFSEEYHETKKEIMEPINRFLAAIDHRTFEKVEQINSKMKRQQVVLAVLLSLLILNGLFILFTINRHHAHLVRQLKESLHKQSREIIDRKQAEKEVRKSEEKYRRLVESLKQDYFIYSHDIQGIFTYVSPSVKNVLGYSQKEFFKHYSTYLTENPMNKDVDRFTQKSIRGEQQPAYELEIYNKDRSKRILEIVENPVFDSKNHVISVEGIAHDITSRKIMEKKLRSTQMQYTEFINASDSTVSNWKVPSGVKTELPFKDQIELLYHSVCIDANRASWEAFGLKSKKDLIGKTYFELIKEKTFDKTFLDFIKNNYRLVDYLTYEKYKYRGDYYGLENWYGVVENGELTHIWTTSKNITEQKKAEHALKESEKRYRSIFENSIEGIYQTTQDGRFISVNPSLATILGFDSPEELMVSFDDIQHQLYVDPEERNRYAKMMLKADGPVKNFETRLYRKDKSIVFVSANSQAIRDDNGQVLYFEGTLEDITSRKKTEKEKKDIEARLQQAQKMETIGTLAGGIAHDFNNILSSIIGFSSLIKEDLSDHDSELIHNIDQVIIAGNRATDLVQQILTFSRHSETETKPLLIVPLIKETVKFLRASLSASIEIKTNLKDDQTAILGDATQVHQIVMNLCTNATHAMRKKGGILTIDHEIIKEQIRGQEITKPGEWLRLTISDTGHGIPISMIDRIFDPFFTTKERGEGTGMGLAVVHGIVKEMDGSISVDSQPDKGTLFQIMLPVHKGGPVHAPVSGEKVMQTGEGRLLFVDDEKSILLMADKTLKKAGYQVTTVNNSVKALVLFESDPQAFDVVVTDLDMPVMDGIEFSEKILQRRPDIPVILCTGFSGRITPQHLDEIGIYKMIMKPVVVSKLVETINDALNSDQ